MLGKGLESLIPKKHSASAGDVSARNFSEEIDSDSELSEDEGVMREERDGLGILGEFSNHTRYDAPPVSQQPLVQSPLKSEDVARDDIPVISGPIFHVELDRIIFNPYQPRKIFDENSLDELTVSIREFGILQPLVVSKTDEETETGVAARYQLIAGHRRLLAAKKAGLRTVPVVVRNFLKKTEALEIAILENVQRQDLSVIETARAYARLSDEFGLTQREMAARLGKSRESIANALRLLSLPSDIQESLSRGEIQESHARILLQISDVQKQKDLHKKILNEQLSVRDIKRFLRSGPKEKDIQFSQLEKDLSEFLAAPVRVEISQNGGKIIIHFYSSEEALGIAQKIHPERE